MNKSPTKLTAPTTDAEAIAFALDNLLDFEVADFLRDWRDGLNLGCWIEALRQDLEDANIAATA